MTGNEGALHLGAQLWRMGIASVAALPSVLRNAAPPPLPRDALLALLRTGWSSSARTCGHWPLAHALDRAPAPAFEPTGARVVHVTSDYQLRHVAGEGEPILVVASLINRWCILDLDPEHSYLAMLRTLGRPIYVIDWLPAKPADDRTFTEYVAGPIRSAVEYICAAHGVSALTLMGYSMGGTLAACFAARFPAHVAHLATICAPVRFDNAGAFSRWLAPDLVDVNLVAGTWDRIPAPLVHAPFWYLDPTVQLRKLTSLARGFARPGYLTHFLATETWSNDNVDMPRGVFRSWIRDLYQRNDFAGELDAIRCPTLAISGSSDTITPPACVEALPGARIIRLDAGHVGVVTSRRALAAQASALTSWLGECS